MSYYWLLYLFSATLLAYSIIMCVLQRTVSHKFNANVRRIYYSVFLTGIIFVFDFLGNDFVILVGRNKLGISEEIWFFSISMFIAFILDLLIISSVSLKEVTFGGTKIQIAEDELVQNVKSHVDLTSELKNMIISQYNTSQSLRKHVDIIVNKIEDSSVDIFKEYREFLGAYFTYQKEYADVYESYQSVDVVDVDDIISSYKISRNVYKSLKEQIESNQSCSIHKFKNQYMFIPYKSLILDYRTILIVLHAKKPMINIEQYIMISLLQQLEEGIIHRFRQQLRSVGKTVGRFSIKGKENILTRDVNYGNVITKQHLARATLRILSEGGLRPQWIAPPEDEDLLDKTIKKSKEVIIAIKQGKTYI